MRNLVAIMLLSGVALTASAKNSYIPVAGTVPGANGTYFRTDLRIFNPSDTVDIVVSIHFLPTGIDGSNISGRLVTVPKREMVVLNDVVGTFLEWPTPAIGALRLDSDTDKSYSYVADSRIYTDSPNPAVSGTYGQYVPAMTPSEAKEKTVVLHLKNDFFGEYRTNVGVMNPRERRRRRSPPGCTASTPRPSARSASSRSRRRACSRSRSRISSGSRSSPTDS